MGGLIGFSVGRPERVWAGPDAARRNFDPSAELVPGPYGDFRAPVPITSAFETPAEAVPAASAMPPPHPGFFAHGGLGTRVFNGLGSFATNYLALSGNRPAQEDLEAEQRAAEQAALLRRQSLERARTSFGPAIGGGPIGLATAPGFTAPWDRG